METTPIFSADDFLIDMRNALPDDILRSFYFNRMKECKEVVSTIKRRVLNELSENTKQVREWHDFGATLRRDIELIERGVLDPDLFEVEIFFP